MNDDGAAYGHLRIERGGWVYCDREGCQHSYQEYPLEIALPRQRRADR